MQRALRFIAILLVICPGAALAQREAPGHAERLRNAQSAAPASVSDHATVMEMDGTVLRQGTNGWVCMPDNPDTPNNSPMCIDESWAEFMDAYMSKRAPKFSGIGIGYMLQEDFPVSNTDPFATGATPANQWVANAGPHIMVIVSESRLLEGMSADPANGGPWVMWKGTPYAHVMIPTAQRAK